jgi:hypothetical protein
MEFIKLLKQALLCHLHISLDSSFCDLISTFIVKLNQKDSNNCTDVVASQFVHVILIFLLLLGLPYMTPREGQIGAGWWPGRHCQFFDLNCFTRVYAEADRMLAEQRGELQPDHHDEEH